MPCLDRRAAAKYGSRVACGRVSLRTLYLWRRRVDPAGDRQRREGLAPVQVHASLARSAVLRARSFSSLGERCQQGQRTYVALAIPAWLRYPSRQAQLKDPLFVFISLGAR